MPKFRYFTGDTAGINTVPQFPKGATTAAPVFFRTYSRYVGELSGDHSGLKRKETLAQALDRALYGLGDVGNLTEDEQNLILEMGRNLITFPSGRWFWCGGTQWMEQPKNFGGAYNCYSGDTLVITSEGLKPIKELAGNTVKVLNRDQEWSEAPFKAYGQDYLWEVKLKRYSQEKNFYCTGNHRWFPTNRSEDEVQTQHLKAGDRIRSLYAPRPSDQTLEYQFGFLHGVVYGDGSYRYTWKGQKPNAEKGFKVRLCDKKAELLQHPAFIEAHTTYPPSYGGDPLVYADAYPTQFIASRNLKDLPTTKHPSYLLGFIRGLLSTDGGCYGKAGGVRISGTKELMDWLEDSLSIVGIGFNKPREHYAKGAKSNYGTRNVSVWEVSLRTCTLIESDFFRSDQKEAFSTLNQRETDWSVVSVQETEIFDTVYCCEEPKTQGFALEAGIETGNCISVTPENIKHITFIMESLMRGSGCGYILEPENVDKFPPIVNRINLTVVGEFGSRTTHQENTTIDSIPGESKRLILTVGDSRQGWASSLERIWDIATWEGFRFDSENPEIDLTIDVSYIRKQDSAIRGFGGKSNPRDLVPFYEQVVARLNNCFGRKLTSADLAWLICRIGMVVVAGNVRRSAEIAQFAWKDESAFIKENMWMQDPETGSWRIDPDREAFKMANITRVNKQKPTLDECIAAVRKQHQSGEGAIMYAPEAIARVLGLLEEIDGDQVRREFLHVYTTYGEDAAKEWAYAYFNADKEENYANQS